MCSNQKQHLQTDYFSAKMAVLPIAWNMDIIMTHKMKELFDYPACKDLGTVFKTKYILKLQLKSPCKRYLCDNSRKVITVQLERFNDLSSSNVHGSISLHESITYKRLAFKAFKHSFKDGEKMFPFEMIFRRDICNAHLFSDMNLHGHISIDDLPGADSTPDLIYIASCPVPEIHESFQRLTSDLRYLLEDNPFSDVTLRCEDVKLFAHKNILSSRSPVFKAMFHNNMKEARCGEITINDIKPTALKAMLNYIYCAKTEDFSEKAACDLLYAADKYELLELKEICVSYLKAEISNTNVFHILDVSVLHDEGLKIGTYDHIGDNFTVLEKSKDWICLKKKNPALVMEILSWIVKFGK